MTNIPTNNGQPPDPSEHVRPDEASVRTRLLRAAADAQLTAADEKSLHAHLASHPEDRAVIEFEQHLRQSIAANVSVSGGAGGGPSAALRNRIHQMLGSPELGGPSSASIPFATHPSTIRAHWIRSHPARWLAIAASVAVVAGAMYFTVLQLPRNVEPTAAQQAINPSHRVALVSFVSSQHEECELHAGMIGMKLRIDSLDKAPAAFREVLGRTPDLGRLAASGLKFKGAGPCAVPGRGTSVHMVFDVGGDAGAADASVDGRTPLVSIFIQQDTGELNIEPGRTYRLTPSGDTSASTTSGSAAGTPADIFVWKADGFVYFLSSTYEPAMERARLALGAKEPSGSL